MIIRIFRGILVLVASIAISGTIDTVLFKIGGPPLGGSVGGLLIGLLFQSREILYSAVCGILYIGLLFVIAVAIELGAKLTVQEALNTLFLNMTAFYVLKYFSIIAVFTLGGWCGKFLKMKKRKSLSI